MSYWLVLGFALACVLTSLGIFYQQSNANKIHLEIPMILLLTGILGTFAGGALKDLTHRIRRLETDSANRKDKNP